MVTPIRYATSRENSESEERTVYPAPAPDGNSAVPTEPDAVMSDTGPAVGGTGTPMAILSTLSGSPTGDSAVVRLSDQLARSQLDEDLVGARSGDDQGPP